MPRPHTQKKTEFDSRRARARAHHSSRTRRLMLLPPTAAAVATFAHRLHCPGRRALVKKGLASPWSRMRAHTHTSARAHTHTHTQNWRRRGRSSSRTRGHEEPWPPMEYRKANFKCYRTAVHVCRTVSVCELLRIENIGHEDPWPPGATPHPQTARANARAPTVRAWGLARACVRRCVRLCVCARIRARART